MFLERSLKSGGSRFQKSEAASPSLENRGGFLGFEEQTGLVAVGAFYRKVPG